MTTLIVLPHVELCPEGAVIEAEPGQSICNALLYNDVFIDHACEQSCACTTCHVILRVLAGIGFIMALFISNLALYPEQEIYSKTGIIIGSIIAAIAGSILLAVNLPGKVKNSN